MSPLRRRARGREPAGSNLARDLVERLGGGGERTALSFVDELGVIERLTFADVARTAARWAGLLRERGIVPGERVAVVAGPDAAWRTALLGVLEASAVAVPIPGSLSPDEQLARIRQCGAGVVLSAVPLPELDEEGLLVLVVGEISNDLKAQPTAIERLETEARDVALVIHDHGPAGLRGITHTHGSLLAQALAGEHWLGVGASARIWCTAIEGSPPSVWSMLATWAAGAELVAVAQEHDALAKLELLNGLPVDVLWLSPGEYRDVAAVPNPGWYDLSAVRVALSSPAPDAATTTALRDTYGLEVGGAFGLPETGVITAGGRATADRSRTSSWSSSPRLAIRCRPAPRESSSSPVVRPRSSPVTGTRPARPQRRCAVARSGPGCGPRSPRTARCESSAVSRGSRSSTRTPTV